MITTFPGVYLAAVGAARALSALPLLPLPPLSASAWLCSASVLRLINSVFGLLSFACFVDILGRLHPPSAEELLEGAGEGSARAAAASPAKGKKPTMVKRLVLVVGEAEAQLQRAEDAVMWGALVLATTPLHFFFTFLFYTDVGANCCVLAAYALMLRRHMWAAALMAAVGVGFRQTNIVWLGFVMCCGLARLVDARDASATACASMLPPTKPAGMLRRPHQASSRSPVRTSEQGGAATPAPPQPRVVTPDCSVSAIPAAVSHYIRGAFRWRGAVAWAAAPFLCVIGAFAVFLVRNGGVVIGDRMAHAPVFHPPMLCYFAIFACAFSAPLHLLCHGLHELAATARRWPMQLALGCVLTLAVLAYCVHAHTHAHKCAARSTSPFDAQPRIVSAAAVPARLCARLESVARPLLSWCCLFWVFHARRTRTGTRAGGGRCLQISPGRQSSLYVLHLAAALPSAWHARMGAAVRSLCALRVCGLVPPDRRGRQTAPVSEPDTPLPPCLHMIRTE
jgi:hypothetical protein